MCVRGKNKERKGPVEETSKLGLLTIRTLFILYIHMHVGVGVLNPQYSKVSI